MPAALPACAGNAPAVRVEATSVRAIAVHGGRLPPSAQLHACVPRAGVTAQDGSCSDARRVMCPRGDTLHRQTALSEPLRTSLRWQRRATHRGSGQVGQSPTSLDRAALVGQD